MYTIHGEIRRGGMGAIMLARDHEVERDVAMKLLLGDDKIERKRFLQEAKLTGSLEHPNIVPIHAMGHDKESQHLFFTMKLIEGENLREILQQIKKQVYSESDWSWSRLLHIFVSICHAMEFSHSKKVIHRDLKPSNIMVGKFGEVQVMDWGVAKQIGKHDESDSSKNKRAAPVQVAGNPEDGSGQWTVDGDVIGTIVYMPPEQALGLVHKLDERSDVYSLGAILYEILCLCPPVSGKNVAERLEKVENNEIEWPSDLVPSRKVPRDLCHIVMMALSKEPRDRYQSVAALREDIERFLEMRPVEAATVSYVDIAWKFLRRHSGISIVVGISAVLLMLIFFVMYVTTAGERAIAVEQRELAENALERYREEQLLKEEAERAKRELDLQMARDAHRKWQLHFEEDFRFNPDDWEIIGGPETKWELKKGELFVSGGRPHLVVFKQPVVGDIKLEFDCRLEGSYLNDVSCFISAFRENDPMSMGKNGYYFGYGSYDNKQVVLTRSDEVLFSELREPLRAGKKYHVVVERIGNSLSMTVNDEKVFSVEDDKPLSGSSRNRIGLFGYQSETYYDNIKIYRLAQSRKVDILELADYYMNQGKYETAQHLYENVTETSVDVSRRQRARSGVDEAMSYKRKQQFIDRYRKQAERAFKGLPRVSLTDLGLELDASGLEVVNLKQLQGLPFNYVDLSRTNVDDITSLRSMPIKYLDISYTQVSDLTPIASSPIEHLDAQNTLIESILPLKGKALTHLNLNGTRVKKVNVLKGMPLRVMLASSSTVDDESMFEKMPLQRFGISGKHIKSGNFLKGKKLYVLMINDTGIKSLAFAKDMPLEQLDIANTLIEDLTPIAGKDIQRLNLSGTSIKDFSFLSKMNLYSLDVSYTKFSDLSLLNETRIMSLSMNYSEVTNLNGLKKLTNLRTLLLLGCKVDSIEALRDLHIEVLGLSPHMLPSNWQSVLQSLSALKSVYGARDEIKANQPQALRDFVKNTKAGKYE